MTSSTYSSSSSLRSSSQVIVKGHALFLIDITSSSFASFLSCVNLVSNPLEPELLSFYDNENIYGVFDMEVRNEILYISCGYGICILDISDINSIEFVDSIQSGYYTRYSLDVNSGFIFEGGDLAVNLFQFDSTALSLPNKTIPHNFNLYKNFPNPFNPSTTINYYIGSPTFVDIVVFDILGREVYKIIDNEFKNSGFHNVIWNGKSNSSEAVSSGTYIINLKSNNQNISNLKIMLIK
tara:strand:- start:9897 stop:10610 length:714 start_codon:yes stop_codon:yes gene_type:complete